VAERKILTGSGFRWALGGGGAVGAPGERHVDPTLCKREIKMYERKEGRKEEKGRKKA
jgi:hypothetical protein